MKTFVEILIVLFIVVSVAFFMCLPGTKNLEEAWEIFVLKLQIIGIIMAILSVIGIIVLAVYALIDWSDKKIG